MKKLLILLAFIPFLLNGQTLKQTPSNLTDLSRYHNDNELLDRADDNFAITDDTLNLVRTELNNTTDSLAVHRTELNTLADSLVTALVHADSIATGAMYYTNTYWDDLRVPMSNTKLNAAQTEPALEEMITGVFAYAFEADADSVERLNFVAQLPHSRKAATDLLCHLHWSPSTTNTDDCYWRFTYTIISINGTFGGATSLRVADAGDGTALKHQLVDLGTIDGSTLGLSSVLIGNVTRLGEDAADTFTGVAYGLEFDLHYEIDAPGSQEETTKY